MDVLGEEASRKKVANVVEAQQRPYNVVEKRAKKNFERQRQAASRGSYRNLRGETIEWWQEYGGRARRQSW